jgi:hypothetical protein
MIKVKKLLPGGLLRPLMRKMVAATQKANMKKTPEIAKDEFENIKFARNLVQKSGVKVNNKKIDTDFLSEKDEVFKDVATSLAKGKRASLYQNLADKFFKVNKFSKEKRKESLELINDLEDYKKIQGQKVSTVIEKDVFKPTMQKNGGLVDLTKDKKYWKGRL